MCPHILGIKRGGSDTERALFFSDVSTREGPWHTAPNYSSPHRCVDIVDVEVAAE